MLILILGASGFIGRALNKELSKFYSVFGTYRSDAELWDKNRRMFHFDHETDDLYEILENTKPDLVISALMGSFETQVKAHEELVAYAKKHQTKILFFSTVNVFDAFTNFPSYPYDKTLSVSPFGKFKIKLETRLLSLPEEQLLLLRLPMVFGRGSHRIHSLKAAIENQQPIDVFPNIVINATHIRKLCMQVLYLINRNWSGIFHLGSTDLMHHNEFITELCKVVHPQKPVFKRIYASNTDRYLALLPKERTLPQHLQLTCAEVIAASAE